MLKNHFPIVAILGCALLLPGCVTNNDNAPSVVPEDRLTDECFILRQRMITNENINNVPEQQGLNPTIEAQLLREYEDKNCDVVINTAKAQKVIN